MPDGQVQDGPKVLSARKRLGMVGVLAVVAGTAVFFNAEEQAAEAKIWDSEMAGLRNATALPDQQNRRFVFANGISWSAADEKCKALGVSICKAPQVCREQDKKKKNKDMLKTGKNKNKNKKGLLRQLCAGKGAPGANKAKGKKGKAKGGGGGGLVNVCSSSEQQDLKSRWVPLVDGASHVWANVDTCDIKTSVPGEKEQGVVACCGEGGAWAHKGVFAAVHPAPVIQAASKMVKQRKQAKVPLFHTGHVNYFVFEWGACAQACLNCDARPASKCGGSKCWRSDDLRGLAWTAVCCGCSCCVSCGLWCCCRRLLLGRAGADCQADSSLFLVCAAVPLLCARVASVCCGAKTVACGACYHCDRECGESSEGVLVFGMCWRARMMGVDGSSCANEGWACGGKG